MLREESKRHLIEYGVFLGIVVVMTAVLVAAALLARPSWKAGLARDVQEVLLGFGDGSLVVGDFVDTHSALSASSAVYRLSGAGVPHGEQWYGAVVRVPTVLGPVPAVFVCDGARDVWFAGYAADLGKAAPAVGEKLAGGVLGYWEQMVSSMVGRIEGGSDEGK